MLIIYLAISHLIDYTAEPRLLPTSISESSAYLDRRAECETRAASPEPRHEQLDIGPTLHKFGRPASWKSQHMFLGNTCFQASIGPTIYQDETDQDPDYYSIDVEARHVRRLRSEESKESWLVYFSRDFKIQDLPESFLERKIDEVVSFDEKTNVVTFEIGKNKYTYQIPKP